MAKPRRRPEIVERCRARHHSNPACGGSVAVPARRTHRRAPLNRRKLEFPRIPNRPQSSSAYQASRRCRWWDLAFGHGKHQSLRHRGRPTVPRPLACARPHAEGEARSAHKAGRRDLSRVRPHEDRDRRVHRPGPVSRYGRRAARDLAQGSESSDEAVRRPAARDSRALVFGDGFMHQRRPDQRKAWFVYAKKRSGVPADLTIHELRHTACWTSSGEGSHVDCLPKR
jgi:hypothetical protein